jgi:hypothetical protein
MLGLRRAVGTEEQVSFLPSLYAGELAVDFTTKELAIIRSGMSVVASLKSARRLTGI